MTRIAGLRTADIRFPTSAGLDGPDAMNLECYRYRPMERAA